MIDMLSLLPEYTPNEFDSRHRLVIVAAQRAKHLSQGAKLSGPSRFTKETTMALDEVLRGKVSYLTGKEARDAMKESKRGKDGETERLAMMTGEDAKEIKKELSVYVDDVSKPTPVQASAEE
jgi:DNA-directed RNA polymerase subunit omega